MQNFSSLALKLRKNFEVNSKKRENDLIAKRIDCDCIVYLVSGGLGWGKGESVALES